MNDKKMLPLGTVCKLKDGKKRVMITGYFVKNKNKADQKDFFDYCGCGFPEGVISTNINLVFNHDQIERIDNMGYIDEKESRFLENITAGKEKIENYLKQRTTNE